MSLLLASPTILKRLKFLHLRVFAVKYNYGLTQFTLSQNFLFVRTAADFCIINSFTMINIKFSGSTHLVLLLLFTCISSYSFSQTDTQTGILTESGIVTVSKTAEGKDMILFTKAIWDEMQKGTRYTSGNLCPGTSRQFCIEIARKNKSQCRSGIGFTCSVFDCPARCNSQPVVVDASNRICSVMLQMQDNSTVQLIFLDKLNWESLQTSTE